MLLTYSLGYCVYNYTYSAYTYMIDNTEVCTGGLWPHVLDIISSHTLLQITRLCLIL